MFSLLAVLCLAGFSTAQVHNEMSCLNCEGGRGHPKFPDCLSLPRVTCRADEVCEFNYGGHETKIRCRDAKECTDELTGHEAMPESNALCTHGGTYIHKPHGESNCQICCSDEGCVTRSFNEVTGNSAGASTSAPGGTHVTDPIWETLMGPCHDQLVHNQCADLHPNKRGCDSHVSLRVCPQTCGLCALYGGQHQCKDTVINNGCQDLVTFENICSSPNGPVMCPFTCNVCDSMLNTLIQQALNGTLTAPAPATTTTPTTTTTTTTTTTRPPTTTTTPPTTTTANPALTCDVIAQQECDVAASLCNMVDNCFAECDRCRVTTTTPAPTTTQAVAMTCDVLAQQDCATVHTLCALINGACPVECSQCDHITHPMTTTGMPMTTAGVSSGDGCIDKLDCAGIVDVCNSAILASFCPLFCGTCS